MADHKLEMAGNGLFCDYSFIKKAKTQLYQYCAAKTTFKG